MAEKQPALGGPADLLALFRDFLDLDAKPPEWLAREVVELAELGLSHPKSRAGERVARDREWLRQIDELQAELGISARQAADLIQAELSWAISADAIRKAAAREGDRQQERKSEFWRGVAAVFGGAARGTRNH